MKQEGNKEVIQIKELLKDLVSLSLSGCRIIHDFHIHRDYQKYTKNPNDFVTDADFKVQTMYMNFLKNKYPYIRTVGQETEQFKKEINFDLSEQIRNIVQQKVQIQQKISSKDLCIWIDPIDSTSSFINGRVFYVTTLIGVTYKNKPTLGIVGIPYKKIEKQSVYRPEIVFGSVQQKIAYSFQQKQQNIRQIKSFGLNKPLRMHVGCMQASEFAKICRQKLQANELRVSGAGFRLLGVIQNKVDFVILDKNWGSLWDVCACTAIIEAMDGKVVGLNGKQIEYINKQNRDYENKAGLIACLDRNLLQILQQIYLSQYSQ